MDRILYFLLSLCLWSQCVLIDSYAETTASVLAVIDGDTIVVRYKGKKEHVRLIGIDTPERRANDKAIRDSHRSHKDMRSMLIQGQAASAHLQSLLPTGSLVTLEFDTEARDRYKRLLAYVYTARGVMLNEEILSAGYASPLTVPPNVRYQKRFVAAHQQARQHRRGLWR